MLSKRFLYIGIILLVVGIICRAIGFQAYISVLLIVAGVLFKVYYLRQRILQGKYRPGFELLFLIVGLALFLPAIYIKAIADYVNPLFLMVPGLILKVVFVVLFIKKIRG